MTGTPILSPCVCSRRFLDLLAQPVGLFRVRSCHHRVDSGLHTRHGCRAVIEDINGLEPGDLQRIHASWIFWTSHMLYLRW